MAFESYIGVWCKYGCFAHICNQKPFSVPLELAIENVVFCVFSVSVVEN